MNSRILFYIIVSSPILALAQKKASPDTLISFDDLPKLVRERNEKVQAAGFTVKANEERTGSWVRSFAPKFTIRGGTEEYSSDASKSARQSYWKLDTSINVYRGGKDALENDARRAGVRAAKAGFSHEYGSELMEARQAYWRLVSTEILLSDRKTAMEKNTANLRSARRRVGAGVATSADAVQFELHETLLSQEHKKLELLAETYRNQLSTALGMEDHKGISVRSDFPKVSTHPEIPAVKTEDLLEVVALNEKRTFEKLKQEQASRWWQPTVDLYSSYGIPSLSEDYDHGVYRWKEFSVGIRVGIDLGEGASALKESRARSYEASALERQAAHRSRELSSADHALRHDIKMLAELIEAADRDVEKAERFLRLTESEYTRGAKNGPDLLGAFQKYYEFRDRRTDLYREYHESRAELESLTSKEIAP